MVRCCLVVLVLGYAFSSIVAEHEHNKGVIEKPYPQVAYHPNGANEKVGVKGTHVEADGLSLRRHTDEGGLVAFLEPNPHEEWSFSYTFTNAALRFPHIGGVYLWYTSEIPDQGEYKGGNDKFDGIMAGLEFRGAQPEIVMAFNNGEESLKGSEDMNLHRDVINPARLRGVNDITVKVISTKKNFKVELYDGDRLLYDSFRYHGNGNSIKIGSGKYFNITSFYDRAPSNSVYKLRNAELFERIETDEYTIHAIHAPYVNEGPRSPDSVMHEEEEIRHLVSKTEYLHNYLQLIIGDINDTSFDKILHTLHEQQKQVMKKMDEITASSGKSGTVDTKLMSLSENMNSIDIRIQKIQKAFADLDHIVNKLSDNHNKSSNFLVYVILGIAMAGFVFAAVKEYNALRIRQKAI
ncbi:hypothetical protein CWI42_081570 [Ordospora colligata]|uniref:L-type lectin-like domain-containing protein n=1 Tax=Ordospora colligata OC4 TaxID=1354746 RepID=A0A0B2UK42_9MICR|nr:uncharacterized protein M896_081570 [Ordospora colligata OC4]KHN69417.1 hypothetical protein M896_081570 [Ordospora colligata OC4]TBU14931.1 hypothetical protein CWI41_081560 [Ordospora colligata]TBU15062.1 hypothetical protein CWI40_081580 [Ordospora colligata]TBU18316.1 hypothetical protein CWI42_081570 [Ordospora colligata]